MYRLTTDKAAAVSTDFYWVPASKMIASAKVQVEYYALRKEPPEIGFLKDDAQLSRSSTKGQRHD